MMPSHRRERSHRRVLNGVPGGACYRGKFSALSSGINSRKCLVMGTRPLKVGEDFRPV